MAREITPPVFDRGDRAPDEASYVILIDGADPFIAHGPQGILEMIDAEYGDHCSIQYQSTNDRGVRELAVNDKGTIIEMTAIPSPVYGDK